MIRSGFLVIMVLYAIMPVPAADFIIVGRQIETILCTHIVHSTSASEDDKRLLLSLNSDHIYHTRFIFTKGDSYSIKAGTPAKAYSDAGPIRLRVVNEKSDSVECEVVYSELKLPADFSMSMYLEVEKSHLVSPSMDQDKNADSPVIHTKVIDQQAKTSKEAQVKTQKKVPRPKPPVFNVYSRVNQTDYLYRSFLYEGQPGVGAGGFSMIDGTNAIDVSYIRPIAGKKETQTDEAVGWGRFSSFIDKPNGVTLTGKVEYHWIKDAEKINSSSYLQGSAAVRLSEVWPYPSISYQQKYYFNDYNGERKRTGDYIAYMRISPMYLFEKIFTWNIQCEYVSEEYADIKSTTRNEGRRGLRDVFSDIYFEYGYVKMGYAFVYIVNDSWNKSLGKKQNDLYAELRIIPDHINITGRYDYLTQPDNIDKKEKKKNLFSASATVTF